eukprot:scaffold110050_cov34-Prasinocladus_malaysianus.AAC.2
MFSRGLFAICVSAYYLDCWLHHRYEFKYDTRYRYLCRVAPAVLVPRARTSRGQPGVFLQSRCPKNGY